MRVVFEDDSFYEVRFGGQMCGIIKDNKRPVDVLISVKELNMAMNDVELRRMFEYIKTKVMPAI